MLGEFARSSSLPHIEARRSCREISCYRPHTHAAFSVGAVESGTSVFSGLLGGAVRLHPGDVILIGADQVHACNPDAGAWEYRMIHADQEWAATVAASVGAETLLSGVTLVRDGGLFERCVRWSDAIFADADAVTLAAAFGEALSTALQASPEHTVAGAGDPDLLERLGPVLDRLRDDERTPRLAELGEMLGLSPFQLTRAVTRATGLSPVAWRHNARIQRARLLLQEGRSIADTAHETGFADQSHFHRVFRAHVAATPSAYRRPA